MKKIVIIIAIVVGSILLFFSFRPREKETVNYEVFEVKKGDIRNTVTATGTIEPITQVEVGTQVSGTIARILADYNSEVKKGQLIAELDKTVLESEYESQLATHYSNQNEYDYQKKNHERLAGLHAKNLVSDSDYETAEYQYEKARRTLEKSRSDLLKAKTNLNYCMIYSPIDGVVISRAVDEGQTVAAMFNTPKLFVIANDLRKMRVIADVDEADIGQVKEGQKVIFTVDAFPDEHFEGSVTQVRLEPIVTSNVVTYEVVIDAPNPDLKLKPGLTASITVLTHEKTNVLMIPLRALRFQPEEETVEIVVQAGTAGRKSVWIQTAEGLKSKNVLTGISDGIYTEVTEGLQTGEKVITGIHLPAKATESIKSKPGGNPLMPNMTGQRPH
ncbi:MULTISPECIES: efflux RND transporter periplasmic adaptor subunit [Butyricimonas]|uniref:efflux RND transporter periplasmic adaptor subunit n=1 Tax=Butyricimonas TaxID=574697 RepID=UPI001D098A60|nr:MULTISPECIES: efflux RND transporter periplasmic adaptor subunit [Butyricimonas]MCB6973260.1 efflux RND transporter periplasmic adaptor subunit [Butyricimonas synergistica]MCG4520269.1 efflux RND transporter periplasmic adaptor subunit [Butyricimonas sp. DFI.6.44]